MSNITERILQVMADGERHSPEHVSEILHLPYDNVKKQMKRMADKGIIERPEYGWYSIPKPSTIEKMIAEEDIPPTIHTVRMVGELPETMSLLPPPPCEGTGTKRDIGGTSGGTSPDDSMVSVKEFIAQKYGKQPSLDMWIPEGPKLVRRKDWEGRKVEISVSSRTVEVDLAASHAPLVLPEVWAFKQYVRGILEPWFERIEWGDILLGYNYDFANVTMAWDKEGKIHLMGWQVIDAEARRWYEKHGLRVVRRETHAPIIVTPGEILENLKGKGEPGVTAMIQRFEDEQRRTRELLTEVTRELKFLRRAETKIVIAAHELEVNTRRSRL